MNGAVFPQEEIQRLLTMLETWTVSLQGQVAQAALDRGDVKALITILGQYRSTAADLVVQTLQGGCVIYLGGLIEQNLLATILTAGKPFQEMMHSGLLRHKLSGWHQVLYAVWTGQAVFVADGVSGAVSLDVANPPHRAVNEPGTEQSIRGSQEAFVEPNALKIAQVRERLPEPSVHVETITIGTRFPLACALLYVEGLASTQVVNTVRTRLQQLSIDTPTNATRIGSLIRDEPWALFPTVRYSERVDWVTLQLASGKVAVAVNGDPFMITVPCSLGDFYRTSEDYSAAWYDASFVRVIRLMAFAFGVMLPGWYIALTEVNPDLISPTLFDIVAGSHTGLPFTPFVEVVVMILVIEILREAAVRLPKVLATTIGTVGAIVVGTAVIKAGFVSPQIIVLMTFTALSLFSVPTYELLASWRLVSWALLLSAFVLGIYGMVLVTLLLSIELLSLTSFGTPYLVPFSPWRPKDLTNSLWRIPWRHLGRRLTESQATELQWMDDFS